MIAIHCYMLQRKNTFLELSSQGQFHEKKKFSGVFTFNLLVKCKNLVLHKYSGDFTPKGTTYLRIQHVCFRGRPFSFAAYHSLCNFI